MAEADGRPRRVAAELDVLEARLRAVLEPYLGRLEPFEVYGVEMLRRPGAGAHDWFAGVRAGGNSVKFSLLPMYTHPDLIEGISWELRKNKSGASVFTFTTIDTQVLAELEALVARAFDDYMAGSGAR